MSTPNVRRAEVSGVQLSWGVATDVGRRRRVNEDTSVAQAPVFVVADGMGGQDAGELASAAAAGAIGALAELDVVTRDDVEAVLGAAHRLVLGLDTTPGRGAGTTVTGVVVVQAANGPQWLVVNLGDSRTYLQSEGRLERVTVDHSEVQELVDAGVITRAEARTHPRRHVVTRALGSPDLPRPDFRSIPVEAKDRVLVCSDGLTSEVDDDEIARILGAEPDPQRAADRMVAAALEAGGRDNVTVLVIDVERLAAATTSAADDCDEDTRPRAGAGAGAGR